MDKDLVLSQGQGKGASKLDVWCIIYFLNIVYFQKRTG